MHDFAGIIYLSLIVQYLDKVYIKRRGGFQVNILLKGSAYNVVKVANFGAIAEMVLPLVIVGFYCPVKEVPGSFNLFPDARKIDKLKRGAVLVDKIFERNSMEGKIAIAEIKSFLRKIVTLLNQIKISILHCFSAV